MLLVLGPALVIGCLDTVDPTFEAFEFECDLNFDFLAEGTQLRVGVDALQDPVFVSTDETTEFQYLADEDRVVGLIIDGQAYAVPHNILWYHEVVNLDALDWSLAVTYSPLTGSSIAFDRTPIERSPLAVTDLFYQNNAIMGDDRQEISLWPQMLAEARCGPRTGESLPQVAAWEFTWASWKQLHSQTVVLSATTGYIREYATNPYAAYETEAQFYFQGEMPPLDPRRSTKERVLGLPSTEGDPGVAFPFATLQAADGAWAAVESEYRGAPVVMLWSDEARGGMAYRPLSDDQPLSFQVTEDGIVDDETGSVWDVMGRAVEGPLAGSALTPVYEAHVAFWGAWAAFHPGTRLWGED